jgi:hypothetical protein
MTREIDLLIDENGDVHYVYDDILADVFEDESKTTTRASHVEPHPTKPGWIADMRPSGGPVLGDNTSYEPHNPFPLEHLGEVETHILGTVLTPFRTRQEALQAERDWLRRERGL